MTFKSRKAQGLSINTLIIAALGLTVLVILGILFFNKTQSFSKGLESCSSKFGSCIEEVKCNSESGQVIKNTNCEKESKTICCVKLSSEVPSMTKS